MGKVKIAVYGAGGFGREVAWLVSEYARPQGNYEVVAFLDDAPTQKGRELNRIPILTIDGLRSRHPTANIVLAIGNPKIREEIAHRCRSLGFSFADAIHSYAEISPFVDIGPGAVICGGNRITTNIRLGEQVQINLNCTIGHDVIMGDYTTLAPGVHVSGWVHMGKRVYVGTGAVFVNGTEEKPLLVGDDAVIGAGACVTRDVPPGITVLGVPAKPVQR